MGRSSLLCLYGKMKEIKRPKIRFSRIFLNVALANTAAAALTAAAYFTAAAASGDTVFLKPWLLIVIYASALIIYTVIRLKAFLICSVRLYQRFAPLSLREKCLFEPSCSEYMIISIEKYGAVKGAVKGCKRISRCHYPNGGEDLP